MSLIEQLESKKQIEFFDGTLAYEEIQPVSEILSMICSICKEEFKTEDEHDKHSKLEHKDVWKNDKEVLKKTSELTALILSVQKHIPVSTEAEPNEETTDETEKVKEHVDVSNKSETKNKECEIEEEKGAKDSNKALKKNPNMVSETVKIHKIQPETDEDIKNFNCEVCPRFFDSDQGRKIHTSRMHSRNQDNRNKCDMCEFKSMSNKVMKKHKQKHKKTLKRTISKMKQSPEYYTCKICGQTSKSKAAMMIHTQIVHNIQDQDSNTESSPPQKKLKAKEPIVDHNQTLVVEDLSEPEENLTKTTLDARPPQERKQILGEKLYPMVQINYPELAGKITEMLLDLDNEVVLEILQDKNSLKEKVEKALEFLKNNKRIENTTSKKNVIEDEKDERLDLKNKEINNLKEELNSKNRGLLRAESWRIENKQRAAELIKENEELKAKLAIFEKAAQIAERRIWALEKKYESKDKESDKDQDMDTTNIEDIVKNKALGHSRSSPQSQPEQIKPSEKNATNTKQTFSCDVCPKEFQHKNYLISHMKNHDSVIGSHACPSCQEVFSNHTDLENHLQMHSDGDWLCDKCDLQFNTREARTKHKNVAHNNNPENECKFCEMKFTSRSTLNRHMMENHYSFKPCSKFAVNKCEFDNDCRFNHVILQDGQHICFKCGNKFNDKTVMIKHVIEIHGKTPCKKFMMNQCRFPSSQCFFSHEMRQAITQNTTHQASHVSSSLLPAPGLVPAQRAQPDQSVPAPVQPAWQGFQAAPRSLQPPDQMSMVLQMVQGLTLQLHTQNVHMENMQQQIARIVGK